MIGKLPWMHLAPVIILIMGVQKALGGGVPEIGRCHMSECSWGMIAQKIVMKTSHGATLYQIEMLGGASSHPNGSYPKKYSPKTKIRWNGSSHTIYVFCYSRLPVVMVDKEATVIDFNSVPGVLESDAGIYVRVCFDENSDAWTSSDFTEKHKLGAPIVDEVSVHKPLELFRYIK